MWISVENKYFNPSFEEILTNIENMIINIESRVRSIELKEQHR